MIVFVGAQLVRARSVGIEHDPRSPPHNFLHQRNIGFDPLDWRFNQHRIVYRRRAT